MVPDKKFPEILAILLLCALIFESCRQNSEKSTQTDLIIQLDSLISTEHKSGRFDGSVCVGDHDSLWFVKAIGTADRAWDIDMQPDFRFDIASVNKSFIAALILMAVEERRLSLDTELISLLDHLKYGGEFHQKITIHHLLTHTSGIPDYSAVGEDLAAQDYLKFKRQHFSSSGYVDFISRLEPLFNPGENFYYSNFAYHLLAIILEELYQMPFPALLEGKICQPLNLSNTFSALKNQEIHRKVVEGYRYDQQTEQWKRNNFIDLTLGRRIFSNVQDLYQWAKAMDDTTFLQTISLKRMKTNHLSGITEKFSYGYGWVVFDGQKEYGMGRLPADTPYIIHGGSTEGYRSMLINIQEGTLIIAILSNNGGRADLMKLAGEIIKLINKFSDEN